MVVADNQMRNQNKITYAYLPMTPAEEQAATTTSNNNNDDAADDSSRGIMVCFRRKAGPFDILCQFISHH